MVDKHKYKVLDGRTGYDEGSVVVLSDEEFVLCPFHIHLKRLDPVGDEELLERLSADSDRDVLIRFLRDRGLSAGRVKKVLDKYPSLPHLERHADDAGIDELTDALIKKEVVGVGVGDNNRPTPSPDGSVGLRKDAKDRPRKVKGVKKENKEGDL